MRSQRYIRIRNWEKFQHYKQRRPTWVKVYVSLLDDPNYIELEPFQRGILHGLWLLAAKTDNKISASPAYLIRALGVNLEAEVGYPLDGDRTAIGRATDTVRKRIGRTLDTLSRLEWLEDCDPKTYHGFIASDVLAKPVRSASPETETEQERKNPLLGEGPKRPAQVLWDSLVLEIYGEGFVATSTERGRLNKAIKELLEVGATPAQISERASEYRRRYQDAALTPQALTGNWSSLNGASGRPSGDEDDSQRSRELAARLRNGAQA